MKNLRRHFTFAPDSEITLEANPDDLTADKLALFRDLGINRLSLGVQSFDEAELRFLGRRHTARQTEAAIELIRAAGFTNLGLDLMYGLPGQSLDAWPKTLETALSFAPEHLSCYQLTITAGETPALRTPLARRVARGESACRMKKPSGNFSSLPPTSSRRGAISTMKWPISPGKNKYVCRHNLKYWTRTPYLGLGPAAHSFHGRAALVEFFVSGEILLSLNAGEAPVAGAETLTPEQIRLETLSLGFRTREGVSLATIREHPGGDAIVADAYPSRPGPGGPRPGHRHCLTAWWWPTACPWGLRIETGA